MQIIILSFFSFIFAVSATDYNEEEQIKKKYSNPGKIDALIENYTEDNLYYLVQLDLNSDSLVTLMIENFPNADLNNGPTSYQRVMEPALFHRIEQILVIPHYKLISDNYMLPNNRSLWAQIHPGSETYGTYTENDAISYDCDCLEGASNCVKLGYYAWYNPFDYWGEAWYDYDPPYYQEIEEVRVTVRGAQCDAFPLTSETYMGMRNNNGIFSQDYQLSIDYTENSFIVPSDIWNDGLLMPQIGSNDNYVIDNIKLEFFYTCNATEFSPANLLATDGTSCSNIDISWELSPSESLGQKLYRDDVLIASLDDNITTYQDWLATPYTDHIYCIEAFNDCGVSPRICNPGKLANTPLAAQNINASDGLFNHQILITWDENTNTETYKIYRDGLWLGINNYTQTEYIDLFVDFDIDYEYCIESINSCGTSNWACDVGFINIQPGDVNNDSSINILDVVTTVNIILQIESQDEYTAWAADLNFDGTINVMDIIILVNLILE